MTGDDVVTTFLAAIELHGPPASTLTDNGRVYTARHGGGRNAFEYLLPVLGIIQKNGSPGHPQTQGKIERFHQTQKRYLATRPPEPISAEITHLHPAAIVVASGPAPPSDRIARARQPIVKARQRFVVQLLARRLLERRAS